MSDCIQWTGARFAQGYGKKHVGPRIGGKWLKAHRVAYVEAYGEVPPGTEIHHRCGNKLCVNPEHLVALTHKEHFRHHRRERKTHCKNGHEFSPENTYLHPDGQRVCRTCRREFKRRYLERLLNRKRIDDPIN